MLNDGQPMAAYRFAGYWKDVGTLDSLWESNMDMLVADSGLDLRDEEWPIYARSVDAPPIFLGRDCKVNHSAINRGCEIHGEVEDSVLSPNVKIAHGARISHSVLLPGVTVEAGSVVEYAILGEDCRIGKDCHVGGAPAEGEKRNLAVLAPSCVLEDGRTVAPGVMLDYKGQEVAKK